MKLFLALLFFLMTIGVKAQLIEPINLVSISKQSSISIRPEVTLYSHHHFFGSEVGEFNIHPKPGISIGYNKRYPLSKSLGLELGVFGGITRFSYTAIAPKENFPFRTYTAELSESLVNPFLSIPILLNFQRSLGNKYILTLFGGTNFKVHFMEEISSGLRFSNAPGEFPNGDVFDIDLMFQNKPINTGVNIGAGIGRILPNHNILQLNFWATIGLKTQVEGGYVFYNQGYDSSGEKILNIPADAGIIESKGSSVGFELRYTLTGIRKRLKEVQ